MATPNFSALLPDVTLRQLDELTKQLGINRTQVVIRAISDLHKKEISTMSFQPFSDTEIESFQDVVLATPGCPGAESFRLQNHYEVHVRSDDPSVDFPQSVQDWLTEHGFQRAVDPQRGPFYYR